jgi:hypothetical protein
MATYRPSLVVNLKLRFDDRLTVSSAPEPETTDQRLTSPSKSPGVRVPQPLVAQPTKAPPNDQISWIMARIPKSGGFEKPGYRQAGKFNFTFDFRDLPIDPRTVRAAGIEIHTGTISDTDWVAGMRGERHASGTLKSVLQTRVEGVANSETLRMVGTVDEWQVDHDATSSTVTLSGRDLRGILLDTPIAPNGVQPQQFWDSIDTSQDIQAVVVQILQYNPLFDDILVVTNPEDWPDAALPSPGAKDLVPRHRKGARGTRVGGLGSAPAESSGANLNFWDVITQFCFLVGAIPFFQGTQLMIRPSSTVFDKLRGPIDPVRNPTPFQQGQPRGRDAGSGQVISPPLRTRRVVYGRDVVSLSFSRKFAGWKKAKCVRCVSVDQETGRAGIGKLVVGIWPPDTAKKAKTTGVSPGKPKAITDFVNIPVPGIQDVKRLTQIAQSIYNEMGRSEVGGEVETVNLASFGGDASDPDLLRLEPGDGVELLVDVATTATKNPNVSSFGDSVRRGFEDQVREIQSRIGDANLARVIVATARGQVAELQRFFRVETVKFSWSTTGVKIGFSFQNYVVARAQEGATASDRPGKAKITGSGGPRPTVNGRSISSLRVTVGEAKLE